MTKPPLFWRKTLARHVGSRAFTCGAKASDVFRRSDMFAGVPPALGSWWGLIVFVLLLGVLAARLLDAEDYLARDLEGYDAAALYPACGDCGPIAG